MRTSPYLRGSVYCSTSTIYHLPSSILPSPSTPLPSPSPSNLKPNIKTADPSAQDASSISWFLRRCASSPYRCPSQARRTSRRATSSTDDNLRTASTATSRTSTSPASSSSHPKPGPWPIRPDGFHSSVSLKFSVNLRGRVGGGSDVLPGRNIKTDIFSSQRCRSRQLHRPRHRRIFRRRVLRPSGGRSPATSRPILRSVTATTTATQLDHRAMCKRRLSFQAVYGPEQRQPYHLRLVSGPVEGLSSCC